MPDREEEYRKRAKALCDQVRHTLEQEFQEYETVVTAKPTLRRKPKMTAVTSTPTRPQAAPHD